MNCWIILLLLCCCGKNNGTLNSNMGCGCTGNEHCDNSCIQPRVQEREACNVKRERECDCECDDNRGRNDGCSGAGEERNRERWMPYTEFNDNDRRECNCR